MEEDTSGRLEVVEDGMTQLQTTQDDIISAYNTMAEQFDKARTSRTPEWQPPPATITFPPTLATALSTTGSLTTGGNQMLKDIYALLSEQQRKDGNAGNHSTRSTTNNMLSAQFPLIHIYIRYPTYMHMNRSHPLNSYWRMWSRQTLDKQNNR